MTKQNNILSSNTNEIQTCSGCSACAVICPSKAISMTLSDDGFWTPIIDDTKCSDCGLCKSVCCKFDNKAIHDISTSVCFSAQSTDNSIIKTSSSGGIAYELGKYALSNGISVCGVIYDYQNHKAKNLIVDDINDLPLFQGSKYIQSYNADAYSEMLSQVKNNSEKKFLVFGTPCQIFGLNKVLEKKHIRENFILIDLFCHGVPSYLVWDSYLEHIKSSENLGNISHVNFRNKEAGWHMYNINIGDGVSMYTRPATKDLFYDAFFDKVFLNRSCSDCEFRKNNSSADIKLGDFWGEKYSKREDGVSAVFLLSERGKTFFEGCDKINIIDTHEAADCLESQSIDPYTVDRLKKSSFEKLRKTKDLNKTINYYRLKFPLVKQIGYMLKAIANFLHLR